MIILENFISAIIGGCFALLGVILQECISKRRQKEEIIRQEKMNIIKDITAYKIILRNDIKASPDAINKFNSALNLIPIIFQDNKEIVKKYKEYKEFISDVSQTNKKNIDSNTLFYNLVMSLHDDVKIPKTEEDIFYSVVGVGI